jgi:hypothetical protein
MQGLPKVLRGSITRSPFPGYTLRPIRKHHLKSGEGGEPRTITSLGQEAVMEGGISALLTSEH